MPMSSEEITRRITAALPDAEVQLTDLAGDNDHWQATVTSAAFAGKSRVQQHQMVYAAFGADMGTVLHALAVKTIVAPSAQRA
jgi:stress-induced morphogen